jgi:hypothetical protein
MCRRKYLPDIEWIWWEVIDMGYFGESLLYVPEDRDPQKYCKKCNRQISDVKDYNNKGFCDECKEKEGAS